MFDQAAFSDALLGADETLPRFGVAWFTFLALLLGKEVDSLPCYFMHLTSQETYRLTIQLTRVNSNVIDWSPRQPLPSHLADFLL